MAHFLPSGAIWLMLVAESLGPVPRHGLEELAERFERNFLVNIVVLHLLGLALRGWAFDGFIVILVSKYQNANTGHGQWRHGGTRSVTQSHFR